MKKRRLFLLVLTVALLAITLSVNALGAASVISGDYKYVVLDDDTAKIIAYLGKDATVNIPSELDGKTVTVLGFGLFSSSSGTHTVVVPDSVVTMDGALQMSGVKNVTLGAGVEKIRDSEFYGIKKLTVSQNNPNFAAVDGVLYDKEMKSLICVPTGKEFDVFRIPQGVEKICDGAIVDVKMNSLIIPNTVTHIGREAISRVNGITSLVIPSSVESMSMYAIYQCNNLRTLKFENGSLKQIGSHSVEWCEELTIISIPANVEGVGMFYACPSLSTYIVSAENKNYTAVNGVLYNKDMTRLASYPAAKNDTAFTVPDSVKAIDDCAFYDVRSLKEIYLHKGIDEIEFDAFLHADSVKIYYEGTEAEFDAITNVGSIKDSLPTVNYNTYIYRPVTGVKVSVTETSATISWDKVPYVTGYRVFVYRNSKWEPLKTTAALTYTAEGLSPGTVYAFAVRSYSKIEDKTVWAPEFTTVKATTSLGTPVLLAPTYGTDYVTLRWEAVEGASGYRVFIKNTQTGKWDIAVKTTGKNTAAIIRNLKSGGKYTFAVRAYVNTGTKIVWAPKYTSINTLTKPGVTTKLTFGSDSTWIKLSWDKVPGATGYRVYVQNNGAWKALKTTGDTIYVNSGLKAETQYIYAVRAYTKYNGNYYWADRYVKVTAATAPAVPERITATKTSNSVTLNWSEVSSAYGYRVFVLNETTNRWSAIKTTGITSYTVENLKSGKNYIFAVRPYINTGTHIVWAASYVTINVKTN